MAAAERNARVNGPILSLRELQITRESRLVLDVPVLDVHEREVLAVIGPNGAGKSTLLQMMAGLLKPQHGSLYYRGQIVATSALSYRRRIALVLQEPLLLNSSVLANVTIGLRFRRLTRHEASQRAMRALERLGVAALAKRPARTLSGGEAQRVSLARALVLEPDVLLLDEPFGALDAPTRASLMDDLRSLLDKSQTTTLFVTHDRDEALALGDRIAVLLDGRIRQLDAPERVFSAPADEAVATFVGVETILAGQIAGFADGLAAVQIGEQMLEVPVEGQIGDGVLVCLRPEDVTLTPGEVPLMPSSARNRFRGRVSRVVPQGRMFHVTVDCGFPVVAMITPRSVQGLGLVEGREVVAAFKATAAHVIRR